MGGESKIKAMGLGKRLKIGDWFLSATKRQIKQDGLKILRQGHQGYFQCGKRRYFCEVIRLVETKTGVYTASIEPATFKGGVRYWQFSYLVKILEN